MIFPFAIPLSQRQGHCLKMLLLNGLNDTGSNKMAASYRQILEHIERAANAEDAPRLECGSQASTKPDPDGKNALRATWAETALRAFQEDTGSEDEHMLQDLLCDLMHWCDRQGVSFNDALVRGGTHYAAETAEPDAA